MQTRWMTRVFNALANTSERRTSIENPQTPLSFPAEWLLDIFNGGRTDSGIRVSEMTALQVGTVYACVNTISNGVASLPLHVYEHLIKDKRQGKRVAYDHSLWALLHNEPNTEMTTHTWLKTLMIHCLLWGNGYCEIERDGANQIVGIWPRNPARTRPIRNTRPITIEGDILKPGTLLFETTESLMNNSDPTSVDSEEMNDTHTGTKRLVLAEDMIHVPGLSLDGRLGQSTVYLARQIMGLALATEKYGAKFFGNGARPAGILTIPNALEDKALENLRRSWAEAHGGENQFKVAVLEQGVKFEKIASTPDEGQMNATRGYQRSEICAVFGVPLHMVAASDKGGGGKSNVEQSSIEFVLYCLNPWLHVLEQEFGRKLFPKMGRTANQFFAHFDVRRLLYPDADSRAKFYASGKQWGYLNSNDIRELEDMNPITDGSGDLYWAPVNMQPADMPVTGGPAAEDHLNMKSGIDTASKIKVAKAQPKPAPQAPPAASAVAAPSSAQPQPAPGGKKPAKRSLGGTQIDQPLYVMRHGTTDANEQDLYRGWGMYALDVEGKQAVAEAAAFLKGKGIKRIVTSSLVRHTETASIVSNVIGNVPVTLNDGLKTLNVGMYTGKSRALYQDEVEWYIKHPDEDFPGGESLQDFADRNAKVFADIRSENEDAGPTLIITSRSNIAVLDNEGVTGADKRVAEPGGIYRLDGTNNLELIFGSEITDSVAGT